MLECFTLKQHLDATRQELSQALYQHDAACRIIARLMRERDEARVMLQSWQQTGGSGESVQKAQSQQKMEVDDDIGKGDGAGGGSRKGLGDDLVTILNTKNQELAAGRKGRKPSPSVVSKQSLSSMKVKNTLSPHKTDKPGVTCIAVHEGGDLILTGGIDKVAILSSLSTGKNVAKLSGHTKKITKVAFFSSSGSSSDSLIQFATASSDMTVKLWSNSSSSGGEAFLERMTLKGHAGEVTDISVHPTGNHLLTVSLDGSWRFYDTANGNGEEVVCISTGDSELHCGQLHPDGLIFATGSGSGELKLWDIREQKVVSAIQEHVGDLKCLSFSENGYMLASGGADGEIKLWDLRKMKCVKSTQATEGTVGVSAITIDYSGLYLAAAAGYTVDVLAVKEWNAVNTFKEHSKLVTGLAWGPDASFLATSSMDRSVKILGTG